LQFAQHSAESQHDVLAAFIADAKPSAITAINTTALSFFMDFSPLKNQIWFLSADSNAVGKRTERKSVEQISRCEAGGF
jgi:hypothetical protein